MGCGAGGPPARRPIRPHLFGAIEKTVTNSDTGFVGGGVANSSNEFRVFDLVTDDDLSIGGRGQVARIGDGELDAILQSGFDTREVEQVLEELLFGDGIGGVELVDIDEDSAVLEITIDDRDQGTDTILITNLGEIC